MSSPGRVVAVGNAIVDVLAHTQDTFLARHGLAKGSMTLIDAERATELYGLMGTTVECSGGSAANSMVGVAALGGDAGYIGKVRDDPLGALFGKDLRDVGVSFDTPASTDGPPTGRSMIFVTPDAQRTMLTMLGASATLQPEDIDADAVRSAGILFLEGYLWDPEPAKRAMLRAAEIARESGNKVALSLSDSFCVERHRREFRDLVERHVDVLFCNEDEAKSLYQVDDLDRAVAHLGERCDVAAVTRGAAGSIVVSGDGVTEIEADPVEQVVDTTGAGDLFAGGFLYGLSAGRDLRTCARIGSIAAGEIIGHFGARPERSLKELVRQRLG